MIKAVLIISICFFTQTIFAGIQTGKITRIHVSSPTLASPTHFKIDGVWENQPACASASWWAIDTDTAPGKSMLSLLLTAYSTNKTIKVWGQGNCNLRSDMETAVQIGF